MIILKNKNFGLFDLFKGSNRIDILDFFELVKGKIDYPKISNDFVENSVNGDYSDLTYRVFNKNSTLSSTQSKKVFDSFSNLRNNISDYIKGKNIGNIDNWELFAIFLELRNGGKEISLFFSLESTKDFSNCKKGSVIDYEVKL